MSHIKNRINLTVVLLLLCFLIPSTALALIVSGSGATKDEAVANAKRHALENALSGMIPPADYKAKIASLNRSVLGDPDKYLEEPEILLEEPQKEGMRVTIGVEIKTAKLKKFLTENEGWIADYKEEDMRIALFLKRSSRKHLSGKSREARYAYAELKGILEDEFGYEVIRNSMIEGEKGVSRGKRHGRGRSRSMDMDDAMEMAADLGARYAVLFDLRIDKTRAGGGQVVTSAATFSVYDTETKSMIESFEVEGEGEHEGRASRGRGHSSQPSEAALDAIQALVDEAALKIHSLIFPNLAGVPARPLRYELVLKKFTGEEIKAIVGEIKSLERFSRLRPVKQNPRTYKAYLFIARNRNDFLESVKGILERLNYNYNLNFDRSTIYISKTRIRQGEDEKGRYIDL